MEIIGSNINCSTDYLFHIYQTYNFVTEWITHAGTMSRYSEYIHILNEPSYSYLPSLKLLQGTDSNVYLESDTLAISMKKLQSLLNIMKEDKEIHLSKSDRNTYEDTLRNRTIYNNMDSNNDILNMDTWFDDRDIQSTMIYSLNHISNKIHSPNILVLQTPQNMQTNCILYSYNGSYSASCRCEKQ